MKLAETPRQEILYKQDHIIIPVLKGQTKAIIDFLNTCNELDLEKDYTIKIEPTKKKRSLDANAYFWKMCRELAVKLNTNHNEIYKQYIRDYGVFTIVPIAERAVDRWIENWEQKGAGWICESLGESKLKGYVNVKCFYGSSVYDTKEMSRLIDGVVADCKAQGIETMTPNELEKLKQQWGCG